MPDTHRGCSRGFMGRGLRFEITAALLVKILLLWALWFLAFRHDGGHSAAKPDIAEIFSPAKHAPPPALIRSKGETS